MVGPGGGGSRMSKAMIVLVLWLWCGFLGAEESRAPSPVELALGLKTDRPVSLLDGGQVVDRLSVSGDGRWLVYAYFKEDIQSNHVRLVSTEGRYRKEIDTPRGFKHTPVLWANRLLFFSLDAPKGSSLVDGIYFGPWDGPENRWTLLEAGGFRDLALSDDGRFLAASTGNFDRAKVRTATRVWPLETTGAQAGQGYAVATGVPGQVRQISWGPQAQSLVIEINIDKPGREWGQSNLYTTENRPGAGAKLLREGGRRPVWGKRSGLPILYFNEGDWQQSRILALRLGEREETLVATFENRDGEGLTANGLAWDPAGRRLIAGVQVSATVAGLIGFSPP